MHNFAAPVNCEGLYHGTSEAVLAKEICVKGPPAAPGALMALQQINDTAHQDYATVRKRQYFCDIGTLNLFRMLSAARPNRLGLQLRDRPAVVVKGSGGDVLKWRSVTWASAQARPCLRPGAFTAIQDMSCRDNDRQLTSLCNHLHEFVSASATNPTSHAPAGEVCARLQHLPMGHHARLMIERC